MSQLRVMPVDRGSIFQAFLRGSCHRKRFERPTNRTPSRETLGLYGVQIDVQRDGSLEVTETIDA